MEMLSINNVRTREFLGHVRLADHMLSRAKGLLGTRTLPYFEGLLIKPCRQVHTMGMRYPISVWFINKENKVIKIIDDLKSYGISPLIKDAHYVLEFPAGWAKKTKTEEGDELCFSQGFSDSLAKSLNISSNSE